VAAYNVSGEYAMVKPPQKLADGSACAQIFDGDSTAGADVFSRTTRDAARR